MPQFDTSVFWGQIFWMFISFGGLYLLVRFILFPRFCSIFTARNQVIQTPLQKSEKLILEIQNLQEKMEQKKQQLIKRKEKSLNTTYQTCSTHLKRVLQKNDTALTCSFKKTLDTIKRDEKNILDRKSDFINKAITGEL